MSGINAGCERGKSVGLLATCLIDSFRPQAAFAAAGLLQTAGYAVAVPEQGCCGQPNFNGGDEAGAQAMARSIIAAFSQYDYVVVPSGSCAAMLRVHYPEMFAGTEDAEAATALAKKTWELTAFLVEVAQVTSLDAVCEADVVMHDSCSALRELQIKAQPRALLRQVSGLRLKEMDNSDVCCGFGGMFCVKYPEISARIADKKLADIEAVPDASLLVSTDMGCLMHLGGRLRRSGSTLQVMHIAEVLNGGADDESQS
jgi:L-lactate dehydrogenase complex protein LldE